jgi:hypothetical protein
MKKKESADASTGATSSRRTCVKRWRTAVISDPSPLHVDEGGHPAARHRASP